MCVATNTKSLGEYIKNLKKIVKDDNDYFKNIRFPSYEMSFTYSTAPRSKSENLDPISLLRYYKLRVAMKLLETEPIIASFTPIYIAKQIGCADTSIRRH